MKIERYQVQLIQIEKQHIELIRYWRNAEKIRKVMEYTDFITEKQQLEWFASIQPLYDLYFIIQYQNSYLGLIHANRLNWKSHEAHSGLFIWEEKFLGTPIPVMASVNLLDVLFKLFAFKKIFAKVKHDNFIALSYNKFLGFRESKDVTSSFLNIQLEYNNYQQNEGLIKSYLGFDSQKIVISDWQIYKNKLARNNEIIDKFQLE